MWGSPNADAGSGADAGGGRDERGGELGPVELHHT